MRNPRRRSPAAGSLGVAKKVDLVIEPAAWKRHGTVDLVDFEAWIMTLWLLRTDTAWKGSPDPDDEPVVLPFSEAVGQARARR